MRLAERPKAYAHRPDVIVLGPADPCQLVQRDLRDASYSETKRWTPGWIPIVASTTNQK
jgi:hypothetical protein